MGELAKEKWWKKPGVTVCDKKHTALWNLMTCWLTWSNQELFKGKKGTILFSTFASVLKNLFDLKQ